MLLKELTTSDEKRIAKINRALKESYGFTLNSDINPFKLQSLYTKISDDLYNLKLNNSTARDAEYMEKVLVKEGLEILRESAMMAGPGGRAMERVVGFLADFVRNACEVGDEYEEALRDAMKQYRSSKYRFDDDHVEYELRKLTSDCDPIEECGGMMYEEAKPDFADIDGDGDKKEPMKKAAKDKKELEEANPDINHYSPSEWCPDCDSEPCECDPEFKAAMYGDEEDVNELDSKEKVKEDMGTEKILFSGYSKFMQQPAVMKMMKKFGGEVNDNGEITEVVLDIEPERAEKIGRWLEKIDRNDLYGGYIHMNEGEVDENMDRYAEQDWVRSISKDKARAAGDDELELSLAKDDDDADDYFSYQAKKSRKTEMKEGYVKTLRKLLEAEVEQAESLIAAKSFSQELQDMVEKLGRLVNEDLPAVSEQMRDSHGADVATNFEDTVSGTLNGIMDQLRSSKQELDNTVSTIADGGMPSVGTDMDDFDADADLGMDDSDLDVDVDLDLDDELEGGDELGGMDAAAGPEDAELGRAKKESVQKLQRKIVEMQEKIARAKKRKA